MFGKFSKSIEIYLFDGIVVKKLKCNFITISHFFHKFYFIYLFWSDLITRFLLQDHTTPNTFPYYDDDLTPKLISIEWDLLPINFGPGNWILFCSIWNVILSGMPFQQIYRYVWMIFMILLTSNFIATKIIIFKLGYILFAIIYISEGFSHFFLFYH